MSTRRSASTPARRNPNRRPPPTSPTRSLRREPSMPVIVALGLIAHGLLHLAVWVARPDPSKPPPFDPAHSWALSARGADAATSRTLSVRLASAVAATFVVAGLLLLADSFAWAPA